MGPRRTTARHHGAAHEACPGYLLPLSCGLCHRALASAIMYTTIYYDDDLAATPQTNVYPRPDGGCHHHGLPADRGEARPAASLLHRVHPGRGPDDQGPQ